MTTFNQAQYDDLVVKSKHVYAHNQAKKGKGDRDRFGAVRAMSTSVRGGEPEAKPVIIRRIVEDQLFA